MAELLIEILSEEIPASMQEPAARNLERLIIEGLKSEHIDFDQTEYFFTPRRIGLFISGYPKNLQTSSKKSEALGLIVSSRQ